MSEMDKILKNKLYNHGSALPSGLWDNIEAELNQSKPSRKWLILILIPLVLGIVSVGYFVNIKTTGTVPNPIEQGFTVNEEKENPQEISPAKDIDKEEVELNKSDVQLSETSITPKSPPKNGSQLAKEEFSNESMKDVIENIENSSKSMITSNSSKEASEIEYLNTIESESLNPMNENFAPEDHNKYSILAIPSIPGLAHKLTQEIDKREFGEPIGCPSYSYRAPFFSFIEADYGPLITRKQILPNSTEIGDSYINARHNSESSLYSWGASLKLGWISGRNIGLKTGFDYEMVNERFTYEDSVAVRNQTVIVIDTIFNPDGTTTISSDTSVVQVFGYEVQRIHNYHRTVEIPFHLSYYFDFDKFDLEISGGPALNIYYVNRGKILDPSNNDRWFTKGEPGNYNVYKNSLGMSFTLELSAFYDLNENTQLYIRPKFKMHPNFMTRDNIPFKETYYRYGIAVGARYYFSGNPNY